MDSCVIATQMYHSETHSAHGQPLNLLGIRYVLGGGFKYFSFSPLFGEDSHFE